MDRRLTARLQSRQGPPLLQPFYDVLKLFGKAPCVTNPWLIFSSYVCLMASAIALLMFFMQGDMLLLCSDGLSSYGDDMDILDICFENPPERVCDELVDYANGNGGHDNISVALFAV